MTLRMVVVLAALLASCSAPCRSDTFFAVATLGNVSCTPGDGGARVTFRAFNALSEGFVDACEAHVDAGVLSVLVSLRTCEVGSAMGSSFAECALPALSPGRYAVGEGQFVVPSDGGVATCE